MKKSTVASLEAVDRMLSEMIDATLLDDAYRGESMPPDVAWAYEASLARWLAAQREFDILSAREEERAQSRRPPRRVRQSGAQESVPAPR